MAGILLTVGDDHEHGFFGGLPFAVCLLCGSDFADGPADCVEQRG